MPTLIDRVNTFEPGEQVTLFTVDLTDIGYDQIFYWTPSSAKGLDLVFQGNTYLAYPVEAKGFEKSGENAPARPVLSFANITGGSAILDSYDDLIGAKVTRLKTFARFLDVKPNGDANPEADPDAHFIPEVYYVDQKRDHNPIMISLTLKSVLDLDGKYIPKRRVLKNVCERIYRIYDTDIAGFDYTKVQCPYEGAEGSFTRAGVPTVDPTEDECNKDLTSCKLRFPNTDLPTWAFPGVRRIRI